MSTLTFLDIFNPLIGHEGAYVNAPRDPGGETNWGITKRTAQTNGYQGNLRVMTRDQAFKIYCSAFWLRYCSVGNKWQRLMTYSNMISGIVFVSLIIQRQTAIWTA